MARLISLSNCSSTMLCLRFFAFYAISTIAALSSSLALAARSDIGPMRARRNVQIVDGTGSASSVANWAYSLRSDGTWADVDYTSGCDARRASWPAASHWSRINTLAAAWHGGLKGALEYAGDPDIRNSIASAMEHWFDNDFTDPDCLDSGGSNACPCGTAGLWNQNWYSNIILIPAWVAQSCLLLGEDLTSTEYAGCKRISLRAFNTFYNGINNVPITGANLMDIASIGIDYALLSWDEGVLMDAFSRVHGELEVKDGIQVDGIREDGSFGFHSGVLYNGNYGKDYANDVLNLELIAGGTEYAATGDSQSALIKLLEASRWMTFLNTETGVVHWDYPALGRMISIPVADYQASSGLKMDLSQIQALGEQWLSGDLKVIYDSLSDTYASSASQGVTYGNRMFYNNDYMVHRGSGYVTSLKMYSARTLNAECVNSQNRKGFHLSDGALYTHVTGNEYEDIFASWDWNMIPGITVDYKAKELDCETTRATGSQPYVGGVSDGTVGMAMMRYRTPDTRALNWRKTWFFLEDDIQYVMISRLESTTSAPVRSVLDQKRHTGSIYVDGKVVTGSGTKVFEKATSLWHAGVGYVFEPASKLSVRTGYETGSWSDISTSSKPATTIDLFSAWIPHDDLGQSIAYAVYPATRSFEEFNSKVVNTKNNHIAVRNDGTVSALLDLARQTIMIAYWWVDAESTSSVKVSDLTVETNGFAMVIVHLNTGVVAVAESSQKMTSLSLKFTLDGDAELPAGWTGTSRVKSFDVTLPTGGEAGRTVFLQL